MINQPSLMGILNITPDSFSDGGDFMDVEVAVNRGLQMAHDGAMMIDIGGESTRPGAKRVSPDEQIRRTEPVVRALRKALDQASLHKVGISIDTTLVEVAQAALEAGACMVNDISAGEDDIRLFSLAAEHEAELCLMHKQGMPESMQSNPCYKDVVEEVHRHLLAQAQLAREAGVQAERIWLDPGIGFGKTLNHNLALLEALPELAALAGHYHYQTLLGTSRKRFIQQIHDTPFTANPKARLPGTIATTLKAAMSGIGWVRVHDVRDHAQALAVWCRISCT